MNVIKTIRASEWWGYKLAPLLAIGYATVLKSGKSLMEAGPYLLYILLAMVLGAAYVSVINDITDVEDDLAIGKKNRMANVPPSRRWIFPALALLAGAAYIASFYPHVLIMALATMPWIAFSCYSIPPVRLKKRGIPGVLADAAGAHIFTSLFIVASMSYYTGEPMDWIWFGAVGVWALCYGLRGILWHMFYDRDNDIASGTPTYGTQTDPERFRPREWVILSVEMLALGVMLWRIAGPLPVIFLVFYLLFVAASWRKLGFKIVIILMPPGQPYPYLIFLADFYQVFLPLSLLLRAALTSRYDWIILFAHLVLFSWSIRRLLRFAFRIAKVPGAEASRS
ncbi:MAG TPA: UbiA family prenyltransferase [Puia sp.]|jgi:4-hydroxybenzoate polyprenyltransferase|nr:UbiA family prenyltransferase [Puia sp.]